MRKIKIISNPYKKEIKYQDWNKRIEEWQDITAQTHSNSKLISKAFIAGFFFLKQKNIGCILGEFHSKNSLELLKIILRVQVMNIMN